MSESRVALLVGDVTLPDGLAAAGWQAEVVAPGDLPRRLEALCGRVVIVTDPAAASDLPAVLDPGSADEPVLPEGIAVEQMDRTPDPQTAPAEEAAPGPSPGWQQGLAALDGTLDRARSAPLPDAFRRLAPVREVLESAGERRWVQTQDGATYVACGFPDLSRPGAKVLLVRETAGGPEILALHRYPQRVGVCGEPETDGYLPGRDWDPDPLSQERTGAALPTWGELVALEGDAVFTQRGGQVYRWDGRRETNAGTHSQALATLVLRWSQR